MQKPKVSDIEVIDILTNFLKTIEPTLSKVKELGYYFDDITDTISHSDGEYRIGYDQTFKSWFLICHDTEKDSILYTYRYKNGNMSVSVVDTDYIKKNLKS